MDRLNDGRYAPSFPGLARPAAKHPEGPVSRLGRRKPNILFFVKPHLSLERAQNGREPRTKPNLDIGEWPLLKASYMQLAVPASRIRGGIGKASVTTLDLDEPSCISGQLNVAVSPSM